MSIEGGAGRGQGIISSVESTDNRMDTLLRRGGALFVFIAASAVYLKTVAPTFSFWDCGEFVACSYSLGIAHPPGSPLYLIIGRLFSVLPFGDDVGWRVNLLSVFSSAGAVTFGYLIAHNLISRILSTSNQIARRVVPLFGAIAGAGLATVAKTAWGNSVEAEVYGLAMLITFAALWMLMVAFDSDSPGRRTRFTALAIYVMALGLGVHMTVFLVAPVALLVAGLKRETPGYFWGGLAGFVALELYLIFATSSRPDEISHTLPLLIVGIVALLHAFSGENANCKMLILSGLSLMAGIPFISAGLATAGVIESGSIMGFFRALSALGIAGVIIVVLKEVFDYFKSRSLPGRSSLHERMTLIYGVVGLALSFVTVSLHGFNAFLVLSAITVICFAYFLRKYVLVTMLIAIAAVSMAIMGFWEFAFGLGLGLLCITAYEFSTQRRFSNLKSGLMVTAPLIVFGLITVATDLRDTHPLALAMCIGLLALIVAITQFNRASEIWRVGALVIVLAGMGFSVNTFVSIRSAQEPMIDQNDPSRSITAMVGYLERKQYGSESMLSRMFERRGEWLNQFGVHERMGFWGFFRGQFGESGWRFGIFFVLGALGIWEMIRCAREGGSAFTVLLLLGTVGLTLYMNFADGTRQMGGRDYLEVRDRDYFWTPGFMFFGLAIGIGVGAFVSILLEFVKNTSVKIIAPVSFVAFAGIAAPVMAYRSNFHECDRTDNYIPYDYGKNLLDSAEKDAVFITAGDNDTFPLWALQAAYHYRTDVTVLNLSLSNTDWYIKQMRDRYNVPITWTDEQINNLRVMRGPNNRILRIQDQVVDHLLENRITSSRPIQYSITTPPSAREYKAVSIQNALTLSARSYSIRMDSSGYRIDVPYTDSMITQVFAYRGLADSAVYQDWVSESLNYSYAALFLQVAKQYNSNGRFDDEMRVLEKGYSVLPNYLPMAKAYMQAAVQHGRFEQVRNQISQLDLKSKLEAYKLWAQTTRSGNEVDESINALLDAHSKFPDNREIFFGLMALEMDAQRFGEMHRQLRDWVAEYPNDSDAVALLRKMDSLQSN